MIKALTIFLWRSFMKVKRVKGLLVGSEVSSPISPEVSPAGMSSCASSSGAPEAHGGCRAASIAAESNTKSVRKGGKA